MSCRVLLKYKSGVVEHSEGKVKVFVKLSDGVEKLKHLCTRIISVDRFVYNVLIYYITLKNISSSEMSTSPII